MLPMTRGQVMGSSLVSAALKVMRRCSGEGKLPYSCQKSWSTAMMTVGLDSRASATCL